MLSYMYRYTCIYTFTVYVYTSSLASRDSSDSSPPVPPLRSSGAAYRPTTWTVFWEPREKSQWRGVAGISSDQTLPQQPASQQPNLEKCTVKLVNLGGVVYMTNQTSRRLNKAKQIKSPEEVFFSKEKLAASGGIRTHDTLLSRPSALPT